VNLPGRLDIVEGTDLVKSGCGGRGDAMKCNLIPIHCKCLHHFADKRKDFLEGGAPVLSLAFWGFSVGDRFSSDALVVGTPGMTLEMVSTVAIVYFPTATVGW
jgi:hypothetical protein